MQNDGKIYPDNVDSDAEENMLKTEFDQATLHFVDLCITAMLLWPSKNVCPIKT